MAYPSMVKKYAQHKYNVTSCANRKTGKKVKYVVVHYTGTTASAANNCKYFGGGNRNASADYFIDTNGKIYKFNSNCKIYYTWHCGDGAGKYGITNANSIGIEVVSAGKEFTAKQKESLRKLVRAIMAEYNIPASRCVRHWDASRKCCPAPYAGSTAKNKKWNTLHDTITKASTSASSNTSTNTSASSSFKSYKVKITANDGLNVREGASANYNIVKQNGKNFVLKKGEVYTIIDEKNGWGKLKSGTGWIKLSYTEKV